MARLARVVVPDLPCHVTHRGNRRACTFAQPDDRQIYLAHLELYANLHRLQVWG